MTQHHKLIMCDLSLSKDIADIIKYSCYKHIKYCQFKDTAIRNLLKDMLHKSALDCFIEINDDMITRLMDVIEYEIDVKVNVDKITKVINSEPIKPPKEAQAAQAEIEARDKIYAQIHKLRSMNLIEIRQFCNEIGINIKDKVKTDLIKEIEIHLLTNFIL